MAEEFFELWALLSRSSIVVFLQGFILIDCHYNCSVEGEVHGKDIFNFFRLCLVVWANLFILNCIFVIVPPFVSELFLRGKFVSDVLKQLFSEEDSESVFFEVFVKQSTNPLRYLRELCLFDKEKVSVEVLENRSAIIVLEGVGVDAWEVERSSRYC